MLLFEKARRKVEETNFFLRELRGERDPNAFEFRFNALLGAGKNVVNSIHAQIRHSEAKRLAALPTSNAVKERAGEAYRFHFEAWRRARTPEELDQFDVLQELRNIEVHEKDAASEHIPKIEARREPRSLPRDQHYVAVYASYMAMGAMSPDVTTFKTTYTFEVDPDAVSDPAKRAFFERFAATQLGKSPSEIGETYAKLLKSLVDYFSTNYT